MEEQNGNHSQPDQPTIFPVLLGEITPQGLLIRLISSKVEEHRLLIPTQNADQLAIAWLINRPDDIYLECVRARKKALIEKQTLAGAVRNPYRIPAGSKGN